MNFKSKIAGFGLTVSAGVLMIIFSQVASADVFVLRGSQPVGSGTKMIGVLRTTVSTLDNGMTIAGKSAKTSAKDLSIFIPGSLPVKLVLIS